MRKPRILIVEDEADIAELVAVNLRHNGFTPVWAEDGAGAQLDIRAVLRRRAPEQASESVAVGSLVLDAAAHRVTWDSQPVRLGPTEFKLLNYLMHHPERVHSRAQLLDKVWGDHVFIEERTVDVHVKRLREALGPGGALLETVRGAGYRLTARPATPAAAA